MKGAKNETMTRELLQYRQKLDLDTKIAITKHKIFEYYYHFDGQVYLSFSGGKDSTVLLHIARQEFPDIQAVFVDTRIRISRNKRICKNNF